MNTFELRNISKVFFNNNVEVEVVKNTNITIPDVISTRKLVNPFAKTCFTYFKLNPSNENLSPQDLERK